MKSNAAKLIALLLTCFGVSAADISFNLQDFQTGPIGTKRVSIFPLMTPTVSGSAVITSDRIAYTTAADGTFVATNMVPGTYRVEVLGPYGTTTFYIVTGSTNANAIDLTTAATNLVSGLTAYSTTQSDNRYTLKTNGFAYGLRFPSGAVSNYVWTCTNAATGQGAWVAASGGSSTNGGTVTSIAVTSSNLTITGSPITTSGTIGIQMPTSLTNLTLLDFNTNVAPSTKIGRMYWDTAEGTFTVGLKTNVNGQLFKELFVYARNNTGATITNGALVYISGATGNKPTVALASSTNYATASRTLAMATEDVQNNEDGIFTTHGEVHELNTSDFAEGALLYLSTTPGAVTTNAPSGVNAKVVVGTVARSHSSLGTIDVKIMPHSAVFDLSGVDIGTQAANDVLYWTGSLWTNGPVYQSITNGFLRTNEIQAGSNVSIAYDAQNRPVISSTATGGGGGASATNGIVYEQQFFPILSVASSTNIYIDMSTNVMQELVLNLPTGSRYNFWTTNRHVFTNGACTAVLKLSTTSTNAATFNVNTNWHALGAPVPTDIGTNKWAFMSVTLWGGSSETNIAFSYAPQN